MSRGTRASFVVRVVRDRRGQIAGVIERVATGAKEAFTDMEAIGQLILTMLVREERPPRGGSRTQPAREKPRPRRHPRSGSVRREAAD